MNTIAEIFDIISDEELNLAIIEIKNSEKEGIINTSGLVMKYARLVTGVTGNRLSSELFRAQTNLLKQAAYRWIKPELKIQFPENNKPTTGICVDAGTSGNPGPCFYRGLDLETEEVLFEEHLGLGTNNIAEFLAICHAVSYCEKKGIDAKIWSDSETAIAWFRNKKHKSTFEGELTERFNKAFEYIKGKDIKINKWLTREWGEIPADFGRK